MMKIQRTPVALAALALALSAQAQQAQQPSQQLDAVVVTGIRASLQTAVNIKRQANAVVDAVSAEDVGKLPDNDVGQALGRIPGISVGKDFGVGASVSIRGTDPQMTYTTLNGQTVASTGWYDQKDIDRSFNYSLLPPELIGGMEVYKSSQADLSEGGIGGTVIVKTRKPLDLAAGTAFGSVRLGKGTISDDLNKEVSGLFSWRNADRSFGLLVAAAAEDGTYIRRGVEADMRWSGDIAPTSFVQERERKAINLTLQAKPATGVELGLNYLRLELDADNSNTSHYIFTGNSASDCQQTNAANGLCVKSTRPTAIPTQHNVFLQNWVRSASMSSDSLVLDGSVKSDGFKLSGVLGTTKAEGGTNQTTNFAYGRWSDGGGVQTLPIWTGTIDASGKQVAISPASNQSISVSQLPAQSRPETWASGRGPNEDKESFAQVDATFSLGDGFLTNFKTGVRATQHSFTKSGARGVHKATGVLANTAGLYDGSIELVGGWTVPKPNIGAALAAANADIERWVEDRSAYGKLKEENKALYGMFDFESGALHGNFGLRYIRTDVTATSYNFDGSALAAGDVGQNSGWSRNLLDRTARVKDLLPSLNAAYDLADDTIVRFAVAKAITRPNFANMFNIQVIGFADTNANNDAFNYGNPALKPQESKQFDLGIEYYYGKGNLIAANFFYKKIDNFITTQTQTGQSVGVVSPDSGLDSWTINRYVNAGGGKITGLELQINHGFAGGFGVAANYTYSDATAPASSYQDQLNLFTLSSKHNVNLVGYYETSEYSARLAYNWRSKYMVRESGWYGNRMHDAFGSLDLSLGWNVTPAIRLSLDAVNLLKKDDIQYGAAGANTNLRPSLQAGFPAWSFQGETTYRLGLSAKF
ncbi:MAG: TonB-dependent receptor [Inhella sp.]